MALVAGGVCAAVVIAGGIATVGALDDQPSSLAGLVDAYVDAVDAGDVATANELAPPDPALGSTALLTSDVLAQAERISFSCGEPEAAGSRATVTCPIEAWSSSLVIELEHDGEAWRITSGLAQLVRMDDGSIPVDTVAGAQLPADVAAGDEDLWLYPGYYPASVDGVDDPMVDLVGSATAAGEGMSFMGAMLASTAELEEAAVHAAEDHAAECDTSGGDDCETSVVQGATSGSTSWTGSSIGEVWNLAGPIERGVLHLGVIVQRHVDGVQTGAHRIVVRVELASTFDDHAMTIADDPLAYAWP